MKTSILQNTTIYRYFHEDGIDSQFVHRLIESMQEEIKPGDKFLWILDGAIHPAVQRRDTTIPAGWHPDKLRLPDKYQPGFSKQEKDFSWCGYSHSQLKDMLYFAIANGWNEKRPLNNF